MAERAGIGRNLASGLQLDAMGPHQRQRQSHTDRVLAHQGGKEEAVAGTRSRECGQNDERPGDSHRRSRPDVLREVATAISAQSWHA